MSSVFSIELVVTQIIHVNPIQCSNFSFVVVYVIFNCDKQNRHSVTVPAACCAIISFENKFTNSSLNGKFGFDKYICRAHLIESPANALHAMSVHFDTRDSPEKRWRWWRQNDCGMGATVVIRAQCTLHSELELA